jgi:AraC-like DNA-binding protein
MLVETNMQISEIVSSSNFSDIEHILRYSKKEKGVSLSQFRKQHKVR